ncbi:uncharacterized protein LOC123469721 isoform X2 [Daphnia magna]|uniref:uncharacterized protein LOC123469721 isoform X2 n=3 Tax=Daphnia magna TaxID=35525 RepID=UPI001E1BD509|nr:uncharacterized protein LOC123469721 isoform X2 [Daphnia magna]
MAGSNTSNGKLPKKMSCFICGNIYQDENRRVGLFHVPKKNFSSWKFVLPELLEKSRLCDIHFDKCDVLKGITVGKDFYPYDRWRLLPSAIPKHLLVKQSAAASRTQSRTPLKDIFSVNHTGNQPTNYFPPKKRNSKGSTSISQTPENKIAMDEDEEHSIVGCAIENTPENKIAMDEDEEHSIVGCAIENTPENKIAMDEDEEHSIVGCAIENTPENKIAMDEDEEHSIVGCAIENTPECLLNKFKACEKEAARIRESFKEQLLEELSVRYVDVMDNQSSNDEVKHEMLYDMCGYLVKTRDSVWIHCPNCKKGLITKYEDLPSTFLSADYTADRNHGGLTFVTVNFFKIIQLVENVMSNFFDNDSHVYISNCYETVMSEICKLKLLNVFCFEHEESLPYIILQYVHIRFHTESKRFRNFYLSKERTQMKTNKKMSRTSIHAKNTLPKPEVNINTKV